jgi:diadenosine tetraphosphate (Ap4A) HIT family hydrolase
VSGDGLWSKFDLERRLVAETRHWLIVTRPVQVTLGSCVVLLKRRVERIYDLTRSESLDMRRAVRLFELIGSDAFRPVHFNYVFSMQSEPALHFHAIPRYDAPRHLRKSEWIDDCWPRFPEFPVTAPSAEWVLSEVTKVLRASSEAVGTRGRRRRTRVAQ